VRFVKRKPRHENNTIVNTIITAATAKADIVFNVAVCPSVLTNQSGSGDTDTSCSVEIVESILTAFACTFVESAKSR